uniref:Uncharacterized protein n=1 Tax=Oryzias latipes TaxID=8090 RepID=A0A3P9JUT5_ORYLA
MDWIEVQRDMEAEKRRLQNILAAEKEPTAASPPKTPEAENPGAPEELLHEIEARRQFLADMEALGQEREYISIIDAEISQVKKPLKTDKPASDRLQHELTTTNYVK